MLYEVVGIQFLKTKGGDSFKILHCLSDFSKKDLKSGSNGRVASQITLYGDFSFFDAGLGELISVDYDKNGYIYDINHT